MQNRDFLSVFLVFVASAISLSFSREPESCHLRELELCQLGAASIFQNPNGLPVTEADMERQCEYLQESSQCVVDYAQKCWTGQQNKLLSMFLTDFTELEQQLCANKTSKARTDYLKMATCLRQIQRKHQKICLTDLQVGLQSIHKLNHSSRLPTACCNINRFKQCILFPIETECGQETLELVEYMVLTLFGTSVEVLCRGQEVNDPQCVALLPATGTKPNLGRNTSALSRVVGAFANVQP